MARPGFIDNLDGNTMVAALRSLLGAGDPVARGTSPSSVTDVGTSTGIGRVGDVRIATAFLSPDGMARVAPAIASIPSIRLLIGSDPIADSERWRRKLGESEESFFRRRLNENLQKQEADLCEERNHLPFARDTANTMQQLVNALRAGNMRVRQYRENFMHAKAYIFSSADGDEFAEGVIAGSSNLTASGLTKNLELNLGRYDQETVARARDWYDRLWEEAEDFDLAALFDKAFYMTSPFMIFLRVLWELYGDEVTEDAMIDKNLPLTTFQNHGVVRALRLIDEIGGVIVADEVGLGKTFIAGAILARYMKRRQNALLVCPAALRDTTWKDFTVKYHIYLETVSFEGLAQDKQLKLSSKDTVEKLPRRIDEYQLVIIDEAHNYRNPNSRYRAGALRKLLYGQRKDVLMLTATPVNNSLWDLYHLTRFFLKQDSFLASRGILSIRSRFEHAMRVNPDNLSPDVLYPIVDATTVKRTRQFIKKYYPGDQVRAPDGTMQTIVFPKPHAISVRYNLDSLQSGLFDLIEKFFDPENDDCINFARYKTGTYLTSSDSDTKEDAERTANAVTGLLLSGILKRFESSVGAFRISMERLIKQHKIFLKALDDGYVVFSGFYGDITGTDDEDFDEILEGSEYSVDAADYDMSRLRQDVKADLDKLEQIYKLIKSIKQKDDPKIHALLKELKKINKKAKDDATSNKEECDNRKVIIFTFFADSARWIKEYLDKAVRSNAGLAEYKGRVGIVVGKSHGSTAGGAEENRVRAAQQFAPDTAGRVPAKKSETDILVSTDVLAEGVNLQQARNIINYDLPWNPMRLVQRHGRIDRIGSKHNRVFMRTIFPADRLDKLLLLEERIARKIAMAAVSVGVVSPIAEIKSQNRDFTETREEIQKLLLDEDPSLYERGGTAAITQSGEEYRHTLRKGLNVHRDKIINMPWKAGSIMRRGEEQGVFFCARAGERTYLRFVHADSRWQPRREADDNNNMVPMIDGELGRCLRIIECSEKEELVMDSIIQNAAYDLWLLARKNIHDFWMRETDPKNLQPRVRPLNIAVAAFIRDNIPADLSQDTINKTCDILEAPWPRRDEGQLREWFNSDLQGREKAAYLVKKIDESGLEPFEAPPELPVISEDDIHLLVWMGVSAASG